MLVQSELRLSIRRRMLGALLWTSVVLGLVAPLMVVLTIRHEIHELMDDTLRASAQVLSGVVRAPLAGLSAGTSAPGGVTINPSGDYVRGRFAWQLVDSTGQVILHSPQAPNRPLLTEPTVGFSTSSLGWRVLGVPIDAQPGEGTGGAGRSVLYVAQSEDERDEALQEAALNTMLSSLTVWLVCVLGLVRRMRTELSEIDRLVDDVQQHDPMDPTRSLLPATREELRPIRDAIDDLGARLAVRVRNERAFTAHAAHALRTPLAGMDAQLAVALRECAPEQQPRLQRVREAAGRFARVVSALLTLFRSGAALQRQPVELAALLARLPVAGLEVHLVDAAPGQLQADPDLLAAALANLFDNAVRHGARGLQIAVEGNGVCLRDDGPGLPPERLQALQAALDREDHAAFTGLGLILCDLVARAHGGRLTLEAQAPSGLCVHLGLGPTLTPAPSSPRVPPAAPTPR